MEDAEIGYTTGFGTLDGVSCAFDGDLAGNLRQPVRTIRVVVLGCQCHVRLQCDGIRPITIGAATLWGVAVGA